MSSTVGGNSFVKFIQVCEAGHINLNKLSLFCLMLSLLKLKGKEYIFQGKLFLYFAPFYDLNKAMWPAMVFNLICDCKHRNVFRNSEWQSRQLGFLSRLCAIFGKDSEDQFVSTMKKKVI